MLEQHLSIALIYIFTSALCFSVYLSPKKSNLISCSLFSDTVCGYCSFVDQKEVITVVGTIIYFWISFLWSTNMQLCQNYVFDSNTWLETSSSTFACLCFLLTHQFCSLPCRLTFLFCATDDSPLSEINIPVLIKCGLIFADGFLWFNVQFWSITIFEVF